MFSTEAIVLSRIRFSPEVLAGKFVICVVRVLVAMILGLLAKGNGMGEILKVALGRGGLTLVDEPIPRL